MMKSVKTRFRAYQLGNAGSLFSFLAEGHFTLVEARLTSASRHTLLDEMEQCGVIAADTLHITSWDADHCAASELNELLDLVRPSKIECPGYAPTSENGKKSLDIISAYRTEAARSSNRGISVQQITPEYITGLIEAEELSFKHIFYNPRHIDHTCANNNQP
jgi:competence protein ComEC